MEPNRDFTSEIETVKEDLATDNIPPRLTNAVL